MSNDKKPEQKSSSKLGVAIAALVLLAVVVFFLSQKKTSDVAKQEPPPAVKPPTETQTVKTAVTKPERKIEIAESTAEPETNAVTAYLVEDFRDSKKDWKAAGYKMNNVKITDQGVTLEDGATNGVLESPPMVLKLPSSMVAPLYKQEVPKGASVKIEASISGDNQTWSAWYPIEDSGNDISPVYPNGTPNPNYGYVPASYINLGLSLAGFVKYRATLSTSGGDKEYRMADGTFPSTLRLTGMRIYHLDTSQGAGKVDNQFPPGPPQPGEQPQGAGQ